MSVDDDWNGIDERRVSQQPLPQETLDLLLAIQQSIADNALAMTNLADALTESADRRDAGMRRWMMVLSGAVIVALVIAVVTLVQVTQTNTRGQENTARIGVIASCVEVGGECFDRIAEREKIVTDADRQLLALEIICYVTRECPEGMTPENIPDLEAIQSEVPVPEPATTTTVPR
jgi:hypothetical protein